MPHELSGKPLRLDNQFVSNVAPPAAGSVTYWDHDPRVGGFGVRVNAGGVRSFFLNYRIDGRERRYTIGPFPRWSVSAARERAKELRVLIDKGQDPAGDKRARREAPTIRDLIERYITGHLPKKTGARLKHINDEKRMLAEIGRHLGMTTKVADIHHGDIEQMHRKMSERIGARGTPTPVRANRILAICSTMFVMALRPRAGETFAWRSAALGNPCRGIERNHEEGRERFFSQAELAAISDALNGYSGNAPDCVRLVMLTGSRPSEAMKAQWSEFDAEPGYWVKPSSHTKQRKVHRLPLSPPAIELIERLRAQRAGSSWLFPGRGDEPLTTLEFVWRHVRRRTGLGADARLYDLRHSFASIGAGGGLSLPVIGRLLGHSQARTTARYAHLADDPLREAADRIGAVITGAGKSGDVVNIKRRST
jgi:integrase